MKEEIRTKVDEIAEYIYEGITKQKIIPSIGLYSGDFGILLFLYYYSHYSKSPKYIDLTDSYAEELIGNLGNRIKLHTFCDGLSGVLYLFLFLREKEFIDIDYAETEDVFDNYIISKAREDIANRNYDFMHGALGAGLYFLKKGTHLEVIDLLINYLYETAEKDLIHKTFKWKSSLGIDKGIGYNIALSHGISSIVLFLIRAIKNNIQNPHTEEILHSAVRYILSQEIDANQYGCCFPSQSKAEIYKSRLGWCYGDLGVGYALWEAGKIADIEEWKNKGMEVLLHTSKRLSPEKDFIRDAGICHGSAGVAMFFRHLYMETQNPQFKQAVDFWISSTLSFANHSDGLAGYKTFEIDSFRDWGDYSLLTGIAGIGLVLLSFLKNDDQSWDEIFLL